MRLIPVEWSNRLHRCGLMRFTRLLTLSASAVSIAACSAGGGDQGKSVDKAPQQAVAEQAVAQQATLSQTLCDLLPKADAERIMGKALVEQRNDDSACHYRDARGTTGTGLMLDLNVLPVSDQCRLLGRSEPLSGVGGEACIAVGLPVGMYTTVVFRSGGRTFEATAPGRDKESELATAVAKIIVSKLGS